jgi:D-sedoheptulose 7-phosphate isomerase
MDELTARIRADIAAYQQAAQQVSSITSDIARAGELMIESARAGGTLLACGNGGSAADAQHIAAEYVGRFLREREPLRAIALNANTSALTAIANDYGFAEVFARQVTAYGRAGDVLLAISTSGASSNVLRAVGVARDLGIRTVALCGQAGGPVADAADVALNVPAAATPRVQELHILVGHILCGLVEERACAKP